MPPITALLHTANAARTLGRALESLRSCDELLLIDHASTDATREIAREYGARVEPAGSEQDSGAHHAAHDWILCVLPSEALSESLEASLFEWKQEDPGDAVAYALALRTQTANGWLHGPPQVRLVHHRKLSWTGPLPPSTPDALSLCGDLLRFQE